MEYVIHEKPNFSFLTNWQCYVNDKQPVICLWPPLTSLSAVWGALYACGQESSCRAGWALLPPFPF